jgi:hypothetical protein
MIHIQALKAASRHCIAMMDKLHSELACITPHNDKKAALSDHTEGLLFGRYYFIVIARFYYLLASSGV